jgi:protein TonB
MTRIRSWIRRQQLSPSGKYRRGEARTRLLRSNVAGRHVVFVAVAASILVHAGFLVATLALMRASRRAPPPHNRYLYVTLASVTRGISASAGGYSRRSGQEHDMHLPKVSRVRRAVRRVTKHLPRAAGLTFSVARSSTTLKSSPASSVVAKANASNTARIFSKDGGTTSSSQTGEARGEDSAGSVSGVVVYQAPVLLSSVIPGYPESARRLGIEGQVVLRFVVDQSGRVDRDIEVVTSLPMLDQAAIDAVRQWRFSPARDRDGNPVRVLVSVPLQFTLR